MTETPPPGLEPTTLAGLNLPPTVVTDHCVRTLSYRGALSPIDLAAHWRVHQEVAVEIVESAKSAGLVETTAGQSGFERHGRVQLSAAGRAHVAAARQRTWYAGALPVSLDDFSSRTLEQSYPAANRELLRGALTSAFIEAGTADEIGQALCSSTAVVLTGAAPDEQRTLADAIGGALPGDLTLPYAVFVAGSVVRTFDPRFHRASDAANNGRDASLLRAHSEVSQWVGIARPVVVVHGGIRSSDAIAAYDAEAKFYLAPIPLCANGGVLAVLDAGSNLEAIGEFASLWLRPAHDHVGIILLRSGERIEIPWQASTLLFADDATVLRQTIGDLITYDIDISALSPASLRGTISARLEGFLAVDPAEAVETLAEALEAAGASTRVAAARACSYLRDRAAYEGADFALAGEAVSRAAEAGATAANAAPAPALRLAS